MSFSKLAAYTLLASILPDFNLLDAKVTCSFVICNLRNNFFPKFKPSSMLSRYTKSDVLKIPYKLLSTKDLVIPSITWTLRALRLTPFLSTAETRSSLMFDLLIASIWLSSFLELVALCTTPFINCSCFANAFLVSSLDGALSLAFCLFC